jgi:hypothetical protein
MAVSASISSTITARLQPDLAFERPVYLDLDAVAVEDGVVPLVELDDPGEVRHHRGDELLHPVVLGARVDDQLGHIGGEEVAHRAQQEIQIVVDDRRAASPFGAADHFVPQLDEELHVALELALGDPVGHGAHDEARARRAHRIDDLPQPPPFLVRADAARDADVVDGRHEHQVAPGQRDVAGGARPLGADRFLGDLDDDLLPFLEQVLDAGAAADPRGVGRLFVLVAAVPGRGGVTAGEQTLEIIGRPPHVRDMQVGALLEADVDERRLHAGEHPLDPTLVDVAGDPALALALDVQLTEIPVLHERHPRLGAVRVNDDQCVGGHTRSGLRLKDEARVREGHRLTQMSGFIARTSRGGLRL